MANEQPTEAGVQESILQWLDSLGWTTFDHATKRGATVLDDRYDRQRSEVIYWNVFLKQIIALKDDITVNRIDSSTFGFDP